MQQLLKKNTELGLNKTRQKPRLCDVRKLNISFMNLISETSFNVKNACLVTLSDTRRNYEVT